MDQKKKNLRLFYVLGIMLIVSAVLFFVPKDKRTSLRDVTVFQIGDTASVDKITIFSDDFSNTLTRTDSGWVINGKMKADESIMMVLLSVMKQVEILRPVPQDQKDEMATAFQEGAMEVRFFSNGKPIRSFHAGTNDSRTISVFRSENGEYYVMDLPGYDSFVTGIFEISEIDWKDRLIVHVTPTGLNRMKVSYFDEPENDFTVEVERNFPTIPGVENLDTLQLMDYLDQLQYFQADRFAGPEEKVRYDSLASTEPFAKFSFDILGKTSSLTFYPQLAGEVEILGVTNLGEHALFDAKRISRIFRSKEYFLKKE